MPGRKEVPDGKHISFGKIIVHALYERIGSFIVGMYFHTYDIIAARSEKMQKTDSKSGR